MLSSLVLTGLTTAIPTSELIWKWIQIILSFVDILLQCLHLNFYLLIKSKSPRMRRSLSRVNRQPADTAKGRLWAVSTFENYTPVACLTAFTPLGPSVCWSVILTYSTQLLSITDWQRQIAPSPCRPRCPISRPHPGSGPEGSHHPPPTPDALLSVNKPNQTKRWIFPFSPQL